MNNAPFKIGDRVVAIRSTDFLIKGNIYSVEYVYHRPCCLRWAIGVGFTSENRLPICGCGDKRMHPLNGRVVHNPKYFALVQPRHEDALIDEAILEQARELIGVRETVAPVGEPVNN